MCLLIDHKYHKSNIFGRYTPFKAKTVIPTYKILHVGEDFKLETPYMGSPIDLTNGFFLQTAKKLKVDDDIVDDGIHSISEKNYAEHYATLLNIRYDEAFNVYPAIIPCGAKYFIGEFDELVSTSLIIFSNETERDKYLAKFEH